MSLFHFINPCDIASLNTSEYRDIHLFSVGDLNNLEGVLVVGDIAKTRSEHHRGGTTP